MAIARQIISESSGQGYSVLAVARLESTGCSKTREYWLQQDYLVLAEIRLTFESTGCSKTS